MRNDIIPYVFVAVCMLSVVFGVVLTFAMNDVRWLWLCTPIILFLS